MTSQYWTSNMYVDLADISAVAQTWHGAWVHLRSGQKVRVWGEMNALRLVQALKDWQKFRASRPDPGTDITHNDLQRT